MRKQLTHLALFTCITAAAAFGSQIAAADPGAAAGRPEAGCRQHQGGDGQHRFFRKMARELGLTDQQKTQAKALFEGNRSENKPLFDAMLSAKQQLRGMVHSGSADETAIRAQAAKVAAAEADLAVKRAQAAKQFLALLTPEQVTKLRAIEARREAKFGKHGRHGDGAPME
jgi:protein CpxP